MKPEDDISNDNQLVSNLGICNAELLLHRMQLYQVLKWGSGRKNPNL